MELFIGDLYTFEMNEELFITLRAKQRRLDNTAYLITKAQTSS